MTSKKKFKNNYTSDQLSELLRYLASQIDGTLIGNFEDDRYPFDKFMSISLKIKRRDSGYSVRVKVKSESSDIDIDEKTGSHSDNQGGPGQEASYKQLKKNMKSTFKLINKDLVAGRIPNREIVESFVADTDTMGRFPEKCGDPYPEFKKTGDKLLDAVDKSDLDSLRDCYAELKRLRNECHQNKS